MAIPMTQKSSPEQPQKNFKKGELPVTVSRSMIGWAKKKIQGEKKICGWWRGLKNKTPVFLKVNPTLVQNAALYSHPDG